MYYRAAARECRSYNEGDAFKEEEAVGSDLE
jgi:hypothetical protein